MSICLSCRRLLAQSDSPSRVVIRPSDADLKNPYYRSDLIEAWRSLNIPARQARNFIADLVEEIDRAGIELRNPDGTPFIIDDIDMIFGDASDDFKNRADPGGGWFRSLARTYLRGRPPRLQKKTLPRYRLIATLFVVKFPERAALFGIETPANDNEFFPDSIPF